MKKALRGTMVAGMLLWAATHGFLPTTVRAEEPTSLFPFVLPWDDATPGIVNVSEWLHKPAGKLGHIRADADGHLYAGAERIRFFGVDLSFSANFPQKEHAEKVAARMAKFGINIVRFHIMDMRRFPDGIFARDGHNTRDFDPEALDRLDYFTDQLKRNGIYVYLCLLNYRPFNAADGLPKEIERLNGTAYQDRHVVGFFNATMLELQKEYARQLLAHHNPYMDATYAKDPAVAFVEINNENGLIHAWLWGKVDELPDVFQSELKGRWNDWLRKCYGTTDKLRPAWGGKDEQPGAEVLANADFSRGVKGWQVICNGSAKARLTEANDTPKSLPGAKALRLEVTKPGTQGWHVRLEQHNFKVQTGQPYALTFWAKADKPCKVSLAIARSREPWMDLGFQHQVSLTNQWQSLHFVTRFKQNEDDARLVIIPPAESGSYCLAGASLRPVSLCGVANNERLEDGSIRLLSKAEVAQRTEEAVGDWLRFLWDTEDRYWQAMNRYLKDELKIKAMVIGTMSRNSTPNLMAKLDCVDMHAYWGPKGASGPSMVNERGGTIPDMALRRVLGKPFSVSEYGHPYKPEGPKTCVSEVHTLRAAYAAFQDWDYLSATRYSSDGDWDTRRITGNIDLSQHPTKMLTLIPAAAMFMRGDVEPAKEQIVATLGRDSEIEALGGARAWNMVNASMAGVQNEAALVHRVAIATEGKVVPDGALRPDQVKIEGDRFVSDTGELVWDVSKRARGVVTVNAPKSKAVIGYGGGKRCDLGGVIVEPGPTLQDGWSAITLTVMEGDRIAPPCRLLITATGDAENTNMVWANEEKTVVKKNGWGEAPSLVEGIPARITLPLSAKAAEAWALDERGQRKTSLSIEADADGHAVIAIGPRSQTLWYEVLGR
ncbi:MAG: carbohydrate binding domain-containing protein [Planctomycetota bacterium]